jgi:hypothetical protein
MFAFLPADLRELRSPVVIPVWLLVEFVLCIYFINSLLLFKLFRLVFPLDVIIGEAPTLGPTYVFSDLTPAVFDGDEVNCIEATLIVWSNPL